jgi:hypothetical protein
LVYFLCCLSFLNISLKLRRSFNNYWISFFFFLYLFSTNFCFLGVFEFFWHRGLSF